MASGQKLTQSLQLVIDHGIPISETEAYLLVGRKIDGL